MMHFLSPGYAVICSIFLLLFCGTFSASGDDETISFPLRIRISRCEDEPVRSLEWVKSHVDEASKILGRHGVKIDLTIDEIVPDRCELTTRAHRHSYAKFADPHVVNVLVAKRIQDLDVPSYNLMGVHWRYRGTAEELKGRRWVFLTSRARPPVLAHELCHFFGIRHDTQGGNLMTPGPSDPSQMGDGQKPKPFKPILIPAQASKLIEGIHIWKNTLK